MVATPSQQANTFTALLPSCLDSTSHITPHAHRMYPSSSSATPFTTYKGAAEGMTMPRRKSNIPASEEVLAASASGGAGAMTVTGAGEEEIDSSRLVNLSVLVVRVEIYPCV